MFHHKTYPNLLQFENLSKFGSLTHFCTTIEGGVSKSNYQSFNLGLYSGDDIENVAENRQRLADMLQVEEENLLFPYQTHGADVCVIDNAFLSKSDVEKVAALNGIDAVVTNQKGVCIGIGTADCVPILIYDPRNDVFAAIHAGWRGTVAKIVDAVINKMTSVYGCRANELYAAIGPSITQEYFEVGSEVVESFEKAGFSIDEISYKNKQTNKDHINLQLANCILLEKAGVLNSNIEISDLCTYANPDLFFSARRQTIYSGRMITGGVLL